MMKHNSFDKNWKDVYCYCFRKFVSNCFVETISLNTNMCHLILIKNEIELLRKKRISALIKITDNQTYLAYFGRKTQNILK